MKSVFRSDYYTEKEIVKQFALNKKTSELIEEQINYENSDLQLNIKEILLNGIQIRIINEKINPPFIVEVEHDFPFMKMHFEIQGNSKYIPKNNKSLAVDIPDGHYNLFFLPKVKGTLTYNSPFRKSVEINFTKDYLKRVFGDAFSEASSSYGEALKKDIPFLMWQQSKPITPILHSIIQDIINCKFEDSIKKIYLESKVTEILTILFNYLKNKNNFETKIEEKDYLKIIEAGKVIENNLKNPPTIPELSLITGLNQCKLKQNFKRVYRKPIFSYITDLRMEKAKKLIREKGFTVSEAAYEIGYKNPQHFTVAFKRKYNYLPSQLKK
ncbi:helix-turn-helix domain-containing protein [Seonamhaeicola sp.]|uniref:helix-turn-helix domain-containing protein n=1 Tax=Seonamhaeicola sp. TaxID=1912245 RepID=UPI00356164C3